MHNTERNCFTGSDYYYRVSEEGERVYYSGVRRTFLQASLKDISLFFQIFFVNKIQAK